MFTVQELIENGPVALRSDRTSLASYYSDLHKDCYGMRPGGVKFENWQDFLEALDYLDEIVLPRKLKEEEEAKKKAIENLEDKISYTMRVMPEDLNRKQILLKIAQMYDTEDDLEHLEWKLGVPYGYITKEFQK